MKLETQNRLVVLILSTAFLSGLFGVGRVSPAFSPTRAEALVVQVEQESSDKLLVKFENSHKLSDLELVALLKAVGFEGKALREAWAVAKKESTGRPLAHNGNASTGDNSYGLFQINMLGELGEERRKKFGLDSNAELLNPVVNAQIAYHMSGGGDNWSAWKGMTQRTREWIAKFPDTKPKAKAIAKGKGNN
jgi:hypothetical protein